METKKRETRSPYEQFTGNEKILRNAANSWRQDTVSISANSLKTITFTDSKPNMFLVQNPNEAEIRIGLSTIPTVKKYEFNIQANKSKTFGKPTQCGELYLLNVSNIDIQINLFSVYAPFDMSILNTVDVNMEDVPIYDGIIRGFMQSLPSGSNKIGKVDANIDAETGFGLLVKNATTDIAQIETMMLSIKNNQIGATDNSRDILAALKGTLTVNANEKNVLGEMLNVLTSIADNGSSESGESDAVLLGQIKSLLNNMNSDNAVKHEELLQTIAGQRSRAQDFSKPIAFCKNIGSETDDVTVFSYTDDAHTEDNPVKCMDAVKWIRCDGDIPVMVKLYYSFADYIELSLAPQGELHDFNFPIYGVVVSQANSTDTGTSTVNIYGGLY